MTLPVTREDLIIVNMCHHHPSIDHVFLPVVTLDNEYVIICESIVCESVLGYLHIGMEKIVENKTINTILPYVI